MFDLTAFSLQVCIADPLRHTCSVSGEKGQRARDWNVSIPHVNPHWRFCRHPFGHSCLVQMGDLYQPNGTLCDSLLSREKTSQLVILRKFWAMQAMASNQYLSSKYEGFNCIVEGDNLNLGKLQLDALGWNSDGREWIGYAIAILLGFISFFGIITWLALEYIRLEPERPDLKKGVSIGKTHQTAEFSIPFVPVDLSFDKLSYTVTASTSKDKLRLLNEVSGVFQAGRMCALMGSSGGKSKPVLSSCRLSHSHP